VKLSLRKQQRGYTLYELIVTVGGLTIVGLVLWVLVHFIAKFW
jgi:Tfp pilus assembly protein FimT